MAETNEVRTEKGISLARGPALILGTILLAAGLYFLYKQHFFPKLSNFPNGRAPVQGKVFLGIFGANGWTGMLTAVAGGLLLFGAAQHLLAKTMSLIVGVALGAAAIIALASGNVLGLAAANHWTELGWGAVAAILLFNTVIPRRRRTVETDGYAEPQVRTGRGVAPPVSEHVTNRRIERDAEPVPARGEPEPVATRGEPEPVATRGEPEPVATRGEPEPVATRGEPVATSDGEVERSAPRTDSEATVRHEPQP